MFSIRERLLPAYGNPPTNRSPRRRLRARIWPAVAVLVLIGLTLPVAGVSAALKSSATLMSEWSADGETVVVQESDRKINFKGRWSTVDNQDYMGGKAKETGAANAKSGLKFTGAAIAWIGSVGPTHGTANIYVDGRLSKTVDTWASSFNPSVVLFEKSWDAVGSHNISIVASGTAAHPAIAVDAFMVRVSLSSTPTPTPNPTPTPTPAPTHRRRRHTAPTPNATPTPTPRPADTDSDADADADTDSDADADADADAESHSDAGAHSHAGSLADPDPDSHPRDKRPGDLDRGAAVRAR